MKIVVFDDDPTGSQSVYGCPLLLKWDEETLSQAIRNKSPLLFLLANTRALSANKAELRIKEIAQAFKSISKKENLNFEDILFVSRGDSTLRGHGVLEPKILSEELGPFDATFHVPAFFEGGRTTVDGEHLLNGYPVHLTSFARDKVFGYSTSFLPEWLEEKSIGAISAKNVLQVNRNQLNAALLDDKEMDKLLHFLQGLANNVSVVVDAEEPAQMRIFTDAVIKLMGKKRFLFRSAASLISCFANLPKNSYSPSDLASLRVRDQFSGTMKSGLIIVGSHVQLADDQLKFLLKNPGCKGLELPVEKIASLFEQSSKNNPLKSLTHKYYLELKNILESGRTPVLFTSRKEINFSSISKRMVFGMELAEFMAAVSSKLLPDLGYVISKGGITTQILLEKGFKLEMIELKGQILPGLSMVCPYTEDKYKKIPIITFPGNLGDKKTLLNAWKLLEKCN